MDFIGNNPFEFKIGSFVEGIKSLSTFHKNQNLLALNINSYMGGVMNIWANSKTAEGIKKKQ